jgi:hypothetical protein
MLLPGENQLCRSLFLIVALVVAWLCYKAVKNFNRAQTQIRAIAAPKLMALAQMGYGKVQAAKAPELGKGASFRPPPSGPETTAAAAWVATSASGVLH